MALVNSYGHPTFLSERCVNEILSCDMWILCSASSHSTVFMLRVTSGLKGDLICSKHVLLILGPTVENMTQDLHSM